MICKKIRVEEILNANNAKYLFDEYAKESKSGTVSTVVKPDIEGYKQLEELGVLDCVGAFDDEKLVGFVVSITSNMYHYSTFCTVIESQFVLKEYRKEGTWKKLLDLAEEQAKKRGSTNLFMTAPVGGRLDKIAKFYGFKPTSVFYGKDICSE